MTLENLFSTFLITCFAWINILIAYQDYKIKKIKNKYLLILIFLLPFFYLIYNYTFNSLFFINIAIFFCIFISLYIFNIIPPGDVKYIMILSLFIPSNLPLFFGFISLVILFKILWNYIAFLIDKRKEVFFLRDIKVKKFLDFFNLFLNSFLFVNILGYFVKKYLPVVFSQVEYIIFYMILIIILISVIKKVYKYFIKKFELYNIFLFKNILYFLWILLLIWNGILISVNKIQYWFLKFVQIFVIFWGLSLFIKSFSVMFHQNEEKFIPVSQLKQWDIVDKDFLYHIFWQYKSITDYLIEKWLIKWQGFFRNFENPVSNETKEKILLIYKTVNQKNTEEKNEYTQIERIKIFQTFWFWPYIFMAFILFFYFYFISQIINISSPL